MLIPDVNILVSAFKEGSPDHAAIRNWLETLVNGDETYGISDLVCSGFLRIVTNPRIFEPPSTLDEAMVHGTRTRLPELHLHQSGRPPLADFRRSVPFCWRSR